MINDSQFFISGYEPASTYHFHMYKVTFGNTAVDWANKVSWASGTCDAGYSSSILNFDGSLIYSLYAFGSTRYLYFISLSITDGSIVDSRYKSSISWSEAWGILINGDYLVFSVICSTPQLFVFNLKTSEFKLKSFTGDFIFQLLNDPANQRFAFIFIYWIDH